MAANNNLIRWEGADIMRQNVDLLIDQFMDQYGFTSVTDLSQNTFTACLMYIKQNYFCYGGHRMLLYDDAPSKGYDEQKLEPVLEHYKYICTLYDKEISISGFCDLTGIERDAIYQWAQEGDKYNNGRNKLNNARSSIAKNLILANEQSLSNILVTGKRNAVAILGALNHRHAWNMPGVRNEGQNRALTAKELPKLGKVERIEVVEVVENSEKT